VDENAIAGLLLVFGVSDFDDFGQRVGGHDSGSHPLHDQSRYSLDIRSEE
jgi:hypothetical protein